MAGSNALIAAAAAASVAWLCACRAEHAVVTIPFTAQDQSALIAVQSNNAIQLFAVDEAFRAQSPILESLTDTGDSVRTTALFYEKPLPALGFEAGPLAQLNDVSEGRSIPTAKRIEQHELSESVEDAAWVTLDRMPSELSAIRVPGSEGCFSMVARELPLRGETMIAGGAPSAPDEAVIVVADDASSDPRLYRIDRNGARELPKSGVLTGFRAVAATGNLEALYISGTITGTPAIAFRNAQDTYALLNPRPIRTRDRLVRTMLTPPRGSEDGAILYTVDERGDVDRYRSRPFELADWDDQPQNPEDRTGVESGMIWNAAGDVYFVAPDGKDILRYAEETYTKEPIDIAAQLAAGEDRIRSLVGIPGLGAFAGTTRGHVFAKSVSGWTQVRYGTATTAILAFAPFRSGFLLGTSKGLLLHYDARDGFCEDQVVYLGGLYEVTMIVAFDELVIVGGVDGLTGRVFIALVTPSAT